MARRRCWRLFEPTDCGKSAGTEMRLHYQPPLPSINAGLDFRGEGKPQGHGSGCSRGIGQEVDRSWLHSRHGEMAL